MSTALPTIPTYPPININFVKSCNILAVTALTVLAAEPSIPAIPKGFIHWLYFLPVDQVFLFFPFSSSTLLHTGAVLTRCGVPGLCCAPQRTVGVCSDNKLDRS